MQRLRRLVPERNRFRSPQVSFRGMRASSDNTTADPRLAKNLRNVYPRHSEIGGGLVGRPGFSQKATTGGTAIRHMTSVILNDGTRKTFVFAGSTVYELNWATGGLTDVTPSGVTIDATAPLYSVFFSDGIVVSDGVNKPWYWDCVSAAADPITDAPVTYGQPVVYFAKLFVINSANRTEIMWSEENDPLTGYDQGGFNNAWQIVQVDTSPIYALAATEEALYYLRDFGVGAVLGRVTTDFQSTGTQEAVSSNIGTRSPRSVRVVDRNVWFLDANNRPQVIRQGGGLVDRPEPWIDAREQTHLLSVTEQDENLAVFWPWANLLLFGVVPSGETSPSRILVYSTATLQFIGVWEGFPFDSLRLLEDADGDPVLAHGSSDGYLYEHGTPEGSIWNDGFNAGDAAIKHIIEGTCLAYNVRDEAHFDRVDIIVTLPTGLSDVQFQARTPYETQDLVIPALVGSGTKWGGSTWNGGTWASGEEERHVALGIDSPGRWVRARIEHEVLDERIGFIGWAVEGVGKVDPVEAK